MSAKSDTARIEALEKLIGHVIHGMEKQNKRTQQLGELQNKINQTNIDIQKESGAEIIELGNTVNEMMDKADDLRTDLEETSELIVLLDGKLLKKSEEILERIKEKMKK